MKIHFFKYQATGNDFVVIDNRSGQYNLDINQIQHICDRKFGVGADGLMLIEKHPDVHFNLKYFNSDGSQSLCGNGSRAAVTMAAALGLVNGKARFEAYDGIHDADLLPEGIVRLRMNDVTVARPIGDDFFIHTGSPHYVRFVSRVNEYPVFDEGKAIRYGENFRPGGTNVNFVEVGDTNNIFVRTYERGVEDETLSCGTGVTAAALAASFRGLSSPVTVNTLGGELRVEFKSNLTGNMRLTDREAVLNAGQSGIFQDIYLIGPAKLVFEGDLEL